jgi:hypothetical protein
VVADFAAETLRDRAGNPGRKPPCSLTACEPYLLGTEKLERVTAADVEAAIGDLTRAAASARVPGSG